MHGVRLQPIDRSAPFERRPTRMLDDRPIRIFVSYAHEDMAWRNVLFSESLRVPAGIRCVWTDDRIEPGAAWDDAIAAELERATVVILLVSRHFLSSMYIARKELPLLLKRRVSDGLKMLWIPIGNVADGLQGDLAAIQALYPLKKPLSARPNANPELIEKIAEEVRGNIEAAIDPVGVPLMRALAARYEPFELLRSTEVASVYRSRDRTLDRPVAIKTLTDVERLDQFVQNVRDAATIADEPNFVNLYEAALSGRQPYCVMQFIEGQNLRKWLALDNRRPLHVIICVLTKITRALAAVHAHNGAYGNLKPSNIVLSTDHEPFILPMGRRFSDCRGAKALDALEHGAPDPEDIAYLAPEQFDDTIESVRGELSDQYMLGLLAYELITGGLPPVIDNAVPTAASVAQIRARGSAAFSALPLATEARPDCSEVLARIIRRMTSKLPDDRYPSLSELLVDVRRQEDVILARVRESYTHCLEAQAASGRSFFESVYKRFFAQRSDARELFGELGERQYKILENAVVTLFAFYEQERGGAPNEPNVLTQVAQHHDRSHKKVGMDFYAPFCDALIDSACGTPESPVDAFDSRCCTDEPTRARLRRAWAEVLRPGMAYMMGRY